MSIVIRRLQDTSYSYKEVVDLLHEAFQERLEQGLKYTCSTMTEDEFRKDTATGFVYVAIDDESGLCGTATLTIRTDSEGVKYGLCEYNGIRSDMKGKGIGTMLYMEREKEALKNGCEYLLSDTATQAKSAVKYHLKNGFKIIGLKSYSLTNYWSYIFRRQLVPSKKWDNPLYCKWQYLKSWMYIRLRYDINGNDTGIRKLYKKLKERRWVKCKN